MSRFGKILNILSLIIVIVQVLTIVFYVHKLPGYVIFIDICCVVIYCIIVCSNLKLFEKLDDFKNKVSSLGKYNCSLKKANDDIRTFRHDFNNIMQAVGGYIKLNDFEGLKVYYNDLIAECDSLKEVATITPNTVNDCKMYNIIIEKSEIAKKMNIKFDFISNIDFANLENLNIDIGEIIKELLDIAIKAAESSNKKVIILDCLYDSVKNEDMILVTTFCDNSDEQKFFNNQNLSDDKKYNSIMRNIEKNKALHLYTFLNEDVLIQELDVNLNETFETNPI